MNAPFLITAELPRIVGDGPTAVHIMVPVEAEVYWLDGALHVIRARVTDFVRLEDGFLIYRAGEPHCVSGPTDIAALEKACADRDARTEETEREDHEAMEDLDWQHDTVAFEPFPEVEFDQRRAA